MDNRDAWTLLFLFTVFFAPSFWMMGEAWRRKRRKARLADAEKKVGTVQ